MIVFAESGWLALLDAWTVHGAPTRIRLFQNDHNPRKIDTIADFVEATFSGYPGYQALAWGLAFVNLSEEGEVDAAPIFWTHNGGPTGQLIYGAYIVDDANVLMFAERFPAPISMTALGDTIEYQAQNTTINQ